MFMRGVVSDGPDTTLDLDGVASWPLWRGSRSTTTCRWRERRGCRSCRCRKDCRSLVAWGSILSMVVLCAIEPSFSPRNPDFQGTLEKKNPAGFKTIFSRQIRKKRKLERRWRSVAAVLCFVTQFVAVSRWHRLFCARRVTSSPAGRRAASAHRVQRMGDKKFQDLSFFSFWNWCQGYVALSVYPSTNLQYFPTCLDTLLSLLGFNFKAGVGGGLAEHAAMPRTK